MKKIIALIVSIVLVCSVVIPVMLSAIAGNGTALTNLYNNAYYKEYGNNNYDMSFDNDNKTIVNSNTQTKAMLKYSTDMTEFESSVTLKGNSAGQIWAGIAFHIQESDFQTATYNTAGYSAYVVRSKTALSTAKVYFRYCTAGASKKEIITTMTSGLPSDIDLKLRLDVAVDDKNATIKLLSASGSTQYGDTLTFPLDATEQYANTSYYERGAFALIANGINTFTNLSITSNGNMANIPEEEGTLVDPLKDKYDIYGNASTDNSGYTTATDDVVRGTLKANNKADFSTELTLKLNDDASLKAGIIFRADNIGNSINDMQGYALILDTTKDDYIRMYLYKYGKHSNGTDNDYLGRIGDYITIDSIERIAGKELVLNLNVKGDKMQAYMYDKATPSAKSDVMTASLKAETDTPSKENGEYYASGKIGFYIAQGYFVNAKDGLVIADAQDIIDPDDSGDSGDNDDSGNTGDSDDKDDDDTPVTLESKYDLYGDFTTDTNGFTTTSISTSRGTLKEGSKDDFTTDITVKLNSEGHTKTGMIFRASNLGTKNNDDMQGYALILDTTKDNSIRLFLYKYGKRTGSDTNSYLGRIGSYVTSGASISRDAGKEIVLSVTVKGEKVEAYFYEKDNPDNKSDILLENLKNATDSVKDNGKYYESGLVGFYVGKGYYINAVDGLILTAAGEIGGDEENEETDPLAAKYDLYGNFTTDINNFTTSTGIARGTLKKDSAKDFSTEVTIKLNGSGETKTGLIFRIQNIGVGNDNMEGYALILDTTKDEFIRMYLYKYGKQTGTDVNTYLGRIGAYVIDKEMTLTANKEIVLYANVCDDMIEAYFYDKKNPKVKSAVLTESLKDTTDSQKDNGEYYSNGLIGFYSATDYYINAIDGLLINPAKEIGKDNEASNDPLAKKYNLYGNFTTDDLDYTTSTSTSRGTLKKGSKDNFSTELTVKINEEGETKTGIIFRVSDIDKGNDNMQGYALILDTTKDDFIRLFLYKYGKQKGADNNSYLGRIGGFITDKNLNLVSGEEIVLHANVVDNMLQAYIYDKDDPETKSEYLTVDLKGSTDSEKDNGKYYSKGLVGFYVASGYYVDALNGLKIKAAEKLYDENAQFSGGVAATDNSMGSAVKGDYSSIGNVEASNASGSATDLESYAADFDNYTFYSSSTTNKFIVTDEGLVSTTAGAKRAMLDGVTVSGFHSAVSMKVTEEGTLRSGIVFRINNIEDGLDDKGALGSNNIEGYAAILYKTPGNTTDFSRVVMCIYKYGIIDGVYKYLGTIASKESMVPLTGFEKVENAAAGQELTMDVNVIDDQISVYFFNANKPELKSETLIADLKDQTDVEGNTPSIKGVYYKNGAIGLTATNQAVITKFVVGEPNYPSTDVGDLSNLESYTIYGSGAMQEGEYITSNSSGTKKLIVNNLTVTDFKASLDMKIDPNGNLKTGLFFRVNEVGNGADAQTGWALVVTRNYATNGETNPNRIDIVLFKWGYANGKLSYLGEVSREVYKSGNSFVDGKMPGEELTFVVQVKGAAIDATLYQKSNPENKPITFSTNLKFAGKNEKEEVAYFESGGIGLYLGNSVSDPVNYNQVRNFHIDDGSGVEVKENYIALAKTRILGIPVTGEGVLITVAFAVLAISLGVFVVISAYKKRVKLVVGDNKK